MKYLMLFVACMACAESFAAPHTTAPDSLRVIDIDAATIVATPKTNARLRHSPNAVTLFSNETMQRIGATTLHDLTAHVPNLFIPAYGSSGTGAIYIRGIGSRIGTPAVGLYVDNVPVIEKSAFSTGMFGVSRVDILRGPQTTLFGRNAMGGLIHIHTTDPLRQPSTTLRSGFATATNRAYLSAETHQRLNNALGFSLGGYWENERGAFRSDSARHHVGGGDRLGLRTRLVYRPTGPVHLDWTAAYQYVDEDAFPYFYAGTLAAETEPYPASIGRITSNRASLYRRNLFNTGLTATYLNPHFTLTSVSAFQHLADRMLMDQDFMPIDMYTLETRERANTLSEELMFKTKMRRHEWTAGLFAMYQSMHTNAPVTFYEDGVAMLNTAFSHVLPTITYTNPFNGRPLSMPLTMTITDPQFPVVSNVRTPVTNLAAYAQHTIHRFILPELQLTLGLRLEHERQNITYHAGGADIHYQFSMPMISPADLTSSAALTGKYSNNYTRLLPKASLLYQLPEAKGNVYATFAEGMRAGGYNVQMFSDLMSVAMQNDMIASTGAYCDDLLLSLANTAASEATRQMFLGIRQTMNESLPQPTPIDVEKAVTYKPEYAYNYEVGTHLNLLGHRLTADVSLFMLDIRHQQIARMAQRGMGRVTVNAGRSRSYGWEATLHGLTLADRLDLQLSYAMTHATFRKYDAGNGHDFSGNRVPFIPMHNTSLVATYLMPLAGLTGWNLTFGGHLTGMGRIYWTEANNAYQNFYVTAGLNAGLRTPRFDLSIWSKNIGNSRHHTFYFESMSRGFYQKSLPLQLGLDFTLHL